jgi:hypothetical protein
MAIGNFGLQWLYDAATSPCPFLIKKGMEKRNEGSPTRFPDEPNIDDAFAPTFIPFRTEALKDEGAWEALM